MRTQREHGRPHTRGEALGGPALPAPASQGLASGTGDREHLPCLLRRPEPTDAAASSHRDLRNSRGGRGGPAGPRTQGGICLRREEGTAFLQEG